MKRKDIGKTVVCIQTPRGGIKRGIQKGGVYEIIDVDVNHLLIRGKQGIAVFFNKKWFKKREELERWRAF